MLAVRYIFADEYVAYIVVKSGIVWRNFFFGSSDGLAELFFGRFSFGRISAMIVFKFGVGAKFGRGSAIYLL